MPRRRQESDDSEEEDEDSLEDEKIEIRKPKIERLDKFKNLKKIVINVSMTQYPVVSEVAEELGWKVQCSNDAGDWDIYWTDFSIDPDVLIKMHLFQKINHYPGIHNIARKNLLGQNLSNMAAHFPQEYNFFPATWRLPQQYAEFRTFYESKPKGKTRTYIVKPEADCQGRGIFLTRKIDDMETGKHYVVQRYMARPYLIDGLKFDLRIYVLLAGTDPLRLYMYEQGLARFATQTYHEPMNANLDHLCMHLTNYAINKHNKNFIFNTSANRMDIGHKRSLTAVFRQMAERGLDVDVLKKRIKSTIIKTVISGLPLMAHQYKFSQPEDYSGNMCFHILGLDVMINNKGEPFVIEVNHTPSFTTDTPLDHKIKHSLIKDTLQLMNINVKQKTQLYNRCKQYNEDRLLTGKRHIYEGSEREQIIKEAQEARDNYQRKHMGGYEKIYPFEDPTQNAKYEEMIGMAMQIYMEGNQAVRNRYEAKEMKKLMRSQIRAQHKKAKQVQQQEMKESQHESRSVVNQVTRDDDTFSKQAQTFVPQSNPEIPLDQSEGRICSRKQERSERVMVPIQDSSSFSKVNNIRNGRGCSQTAEPKQLNPLGFARRDNSSTYNNRDSSLKINNGRESQGRGNKINHPISALKRNLPNPNSNLNPNNNQLAKQLPNIDNSSGVSDLFNGSSVNHARRKHQNKQASHPQKFLKSEPKPSKMMEDLEREMRSFQDKKMMGMSNGGYVMPKIFCLNMESERREVSLNMLTLGKKVQSAHYNDA